MSSPLFTAAAVSAGGVYGANTVPAYTKPVRTVQTSFDSYWTLGDFGDADPTALSIAAVPPDVPSLATVGVLLAVFGYAIGTVGAILCTVLMQLAAVS